MRGRARAESDDDDDDDDDGGRNGDDGCVERDENIAYSSSFAMSRVRVELEGLSADGSQILQKPKLQNESDADDPSLNAALSTIAQVVLLADRRGAQEANRRRLAQLGNDTVLGTRSDASKIAPNRTSECHGTHD